MPSWFSVWLEFLQSVRYLCGRGSYIWKGVSKPQIVIVFSCQKTQSSAEALTAVPCHEENSSTSKQRSIYPYHILCSGGVRNLSIILKTVHNFKELYQEARVSDFFSFLFWHFDTVLLRRKEKIIIDRPISSMSRGRLNKRVLFQFL